MASPYHSQSGYPQNPPLEGNSFDSSQLPVMPYERMISSMGNSASKSWSGNGSQHIPIPKHPAQSHPLGRSHAQIGHVTQFSGQRGQQPANRSSPYSHTYQGTYMQ